MGRLREKSKHLLTENKQLKEDYWKLQIENAWQKGRIQRLESEISDMKSK